MKSAGYKSMRLHIQVCAGPAVYTIQYVLPTLAEWIESFDAAHWRIKDLLPADESYLGGDPINVLLIDFWLLMELYQSLKDRDLDQSTPWGLQEEYILKRLNDVDHKGNKKNQ